MKTWPALLAAILLPACGARSELYAPAPFYVDPGPPPAYCQDAGGTSIYVVTQQKELFAFDPPSRSFTPVGTLDCPLANPSATPFSMAVGYEGTGYVVFDDGDGTSELFVVGSSTAACTAPPTPLDASAFTPTFGMGFSTNPDGLGETLYLASIARPGALGTLDTTTFTAQPIAAFSPDIGQAELTGTGAGELFGFGIVGSEAGANIALIDKTTAQVVIEGAVPSPANVTDWAFGFWGGDFYFFTAVDHGSSSVIRYHPEDGSFEPDYATLPGQSIVGAGVSTCAPR